MSRTIPLSRLATGSFYGFLFSIPGEPEGLGQIQGGVRQRQTMDRRPEVRRVPLGPAIRLEASKCALAQVDREGPLPIPGLAVHRARTAALRAVATQLTQEPQMRQHPFQAHLLAHEGEIDARSHGG